jgi:hypothetical protein
MSDTVFIYLIVALNTLVQIMVIWRLKFPAGGRGGYYVLAVAIPVFVIVSMRLLVTSGMIHGLVADQTSMERHVTTAAGILLIAGPWIATLAAFFAVKRKRAASTPQPEAKESE